MGLILIPSEITGLVSQVKSYVESSVSSYTDARQAVSEYVDNNGLDTEAWNASKSTMHVCYQAIADGMLLAQESINSDLDTLEGSVGTEDLFEDELDAQIKRLQAEIQTYEKCIKLWNRYLGMLFGAFDGSISSKISAYENLIKTNEGLIKELQEKIIFLHEVEDVTSNLFQAANNLFAMVRNAINDGGVVISGGKPSTNPGWLNSISNAVREIIEPMLEATLEEELGIDLNTFIELYGEETLRNIEGCIKREIDKNGEISSQNLFIKILETTSGYAVEVVDGKYQFNDGRWYFFTRYSKEEVVKIAKREQLIDDTPEIVTKEMFIKCDWDASLLTDEMLKECNQALDKYEINTTERLNHFIAQCSYESSYGSAVKEEGPKEYFKDKTYDFQYRGTGYIHMTHEYAYKAFATYLILEEYPELGQYKNPGKNSSEIISNEYESILQNAKKPENAGAVQNIEMYTKIVSEGCEYVNQNFAWESAAYYWAIANELNQKVDDGATVDEVSEKINSGARVNFGDRATYYNNIVNNNAFANLGMEEDSDE